MAQSQFIDLQRNGQQVEAPEVKPFPSHPYERFSEERESLETVPVENRTVRWETRVVGVDKECSESGELLLASAIGILVVIVALNTMHRS